MLTNSYKIRIFTHLRQQKRWKCHPFATVIYKNCFELKNRVELVEFLTVRPCSLPFYKVLRPVACSKSSTDREAITSVS